MRHALAQHVRQHDTAAGRTIWIVDAHGYAKRFIVRADQKLTAFMELESAVCGRQMAARACFLWRDSRSSLTESS